ncbi:Crp/Fnr family transcriptional regulator [Pedobacter xixiisoli]|uniref:cAMP-binding domain of CRP or a regulatory subunit of cAMP-dependent protein kinases n=1 Tax=Pedobacter xixiisoli TaxID=1476464 RepID=A0A285ZW95_9SPHI|nr:Crp/Fnr family transcriptional regulator [Pedobacter xixiisoli]SOD13906.1 cAMP-binding domain of CRP or a regulatory subunit of cAMP-dependent protein kinases [Pedobacter xixiisoli]
MIDIKQIIDALAPISSCQTDTKILFGSCFTLQKIKKGQLVPQERKKRMLYFLSQGLLHKYYQASVEPLSSIEPSPATPVEQSSNTIRFYESGSFFQRHPIDDNKFSPYHLCALSDSTIYQCNYENIIELYQTDHSIAELFLHLQDNWTKRLTDEIILQHQEPALLRYQKFRERQQSANQIPMKFIASYLHISRKHLGRLNRQLLKTK